MKKIVFLMSILSLFLMSFSCSKSDPDPGIPLHDYSSQYKTDDDSIQKFLETHSMTVNPTTFDVTFTPLPTTGTIPQSIKAQTVYPLQDTLIYDNGVNYHVKFLKFNEGDLVNGKRPTQVDSVYVAYKGLGMTTTKTPVVFDYESTPIWFRLDEVIKGWTSMLPNFHSGTYSTTSGPDPATFSNFGAGVLFLPSGLAYFNNSLSNVGSYTPLIFSFKLMNVRYRDHDRDGVLSKDERALSSSTPAAIRWKESPWSGFENLTYTDATNTAVQTQSYTLYDTDGDGSVNMADRDDDGDGYLTLGEIKDASGVKYPFNLIPSCSAGGLKRHLDPSCH